MRKSKKVLQKIIYFFLIITIIWACFSFVKATEDEITGGSSETEITDDLNDDIETVKSETKSNNNLYIRENNVLIDYSVSGNAYIIAKSVTIDSIIDGNIFIMADEVTLTEKSYIYTDAFIMANKVTIAGYVYDLYCTSNVLDINDTSYILRDLYSFAKTINIRGHIERDAYISSNNINISGESPLISGNLNYSANNEINLSDSSVGGHVNFTPNTSVSFSSLNSIISDLVKSLIYSIIIILVIVLVFKSFSDKVFEVAKSSFGKVLIYGFLGLICIPIISLILIITIIGIPIGFVILAAYAFALSITSAITSIVLGKFMYEKITKNTQNLSNSKFILICSLAALILYLLSQIPYIGILVTFIKIIFGLGIIIYLLKNSKK